MILLTNGTVYTIVTKPISGGAVLIKNNKIKEIYKSSKEIPQSVLTKAKRIINTNGGWILPGFIEAHCHIGIQEEQIGDSGNDMNEFVSPVTPHLSALDAINPMEKAFKNALKAGITSVMVGPGSSNVVGGQFAFIKTCGKVIDDMVVLSPAAMKIAFGENPKNAYEELKTSPVTRMANAAMLREEITKAIQYKKKREEGEEIDFRYECWIPVLEHKIPLKAHVHRTDDIMTAIRIAKEFHLDLTLDHCSEGHLIADRLAKERIPAIVGPSLVARYKEEMRNTCFQTAGILSEAGVDIAITTDHPVCPIQMLPICAGLAAREGLPPDEARKAITFNAAKICRVEHRVGSLQVGLDADIAVFDGDPLNTLTQTLYTLIDGKIVYEKSIDPKTSLP
ncbi:MAG: amidohydrolase [Lachnoclostridium sp.]|nr:amidohydrolase [Lachnoclostridium sp.]